MGRHSLVPGKQLFPDWVGVDQSFFREWRFASSIGFVLQAIVTLTRSWPPESSMINDAIDWNSKCKPSNTRLNSFVSQPACEKCSSSYIKFELVKTVEQIWVPNCSTINLLTRKTMYNDVGCKDKTFSS